MKKIIMLMFLIILIFINFEVLNFGNENFLNNPQNNHNAFLFYNKIAIKSIFNDQNEHNQSLEQIKKVNESINDIQKLSIDQIFLLKSLFPKEYGNMMKKYYENIYETLNKASSGKVINNITWDNLDENIKKIFMNLGPNDEVLEIIFSNEDLFEILKNSNLEDNEFVELFYKELQIKFEDYYFIKVDISNHNK